MEEITIGGRYRHFKGKEYRVISIAKDSETKEEYVVYQALYGEGDIWVRPKTMFLEVLRREWYNGSRFTYLEE